MPRQRALQSLLHFVKLRKARASGDGMDVKGFAFWGVLGAFVYAAPRLLVSISDFKPDRRAWMPWGEFAIAMLIGAIGAAACGGLVASTIHQTQSADLRAIGLILGMVANPVSPAIVHLVGENILHRLNAPLKPVKPRKTS